MKKVFKIGDNIALDLSNFLSIGNIKTKTVNFLGFFWNRLLGVVIVFLILTQFHPIHLVIFLIWLIFELQITVTSESTSKPKRKWSLFKRRKKS